MARTFLPNVYNLYGTMEDDEMIDGPNWDYDMTTVEVEEEEEEESKGMTYPYYSSDEEDRSGVDWGVYYKMVEESQGFDVPPDYPVALPGQIVPLTYIKGSMDRLIFCCHLALKHYCDNEGEDLGFRRVLKANAMLQGTYMVYFITFEAKGSGRKVGVYQAKVRYHFVEVETSVVEIMRPKPNPAGGEGTPGDASPAWEFLESVKIKYSCF